MKKSILLAVCMMAIAVCAQEKKGGFALELNLGTTHVGNYSPLSVEKDLTDGYSLIPTENISLGYYNNNGWFMGASLTVFGGNTSQVVQEEKFEDINFMIDVRRYFSLGHNFELEAGVALGLLYQGNTIEYGSKHLQYNRWGMSGGLTFGLNYKINERIYIGIRTMYPYNGSLFEDSHKLPVGLDANENNQISGYNIMLSYGFRF